MVVFSQIVKQTIKLRIRFIKYASVFTRKLLAKSGLFMQIHNLSDQTIVMSNHPYETMAYCPCSLINVKIWPNSKSVDLVTKGEVTKSFQGHGGGETDSLDKQDTR